MQEQQFITYLYWLKDRGLAYPSLRPESIGETEPASEKAEKDEPIAASESVRLVFISRDALLANEREMVTRIASALGLGAQDFRIILPNDAPLFASDFAVGLGELDAATAPELTIPHPRDMLREPQLKVSAWEKLQTLRSALS